MRAAIESRDADAFSEHVDFPALRESVRGQMMIMMSERMSSAEMKDNPFAALGQTLAITLINPMLDAAVSPAGVIAMMERGSTMPTNRGTQASASNSDMVDYTVSYRGWDKVIVGRRGHNSGNFVLKRDGLWSWKLAAVELPKEPMAR
jgi:hypothetical protein